MYISIPSIIGCSSAVLLSVNIERKREKSSFFQPIILYNVRNTEILHNNVDLKKRKKINRNNSLPIN